MIKRGYFDEQIMDVIKVCLPITTVMVCVAGIITNLMSFKWAIIISALSIIIWWVIK